MPKIAIDNETSEALEFLLSRLETDSNKQQSDKPSAVYISTFDNLKQDYAKLHKGRQIELYNQGVFDRYWDYKSIVTEQLREIAQYPSGQRLLKKIHSLASNDSGGKPFKILVKNQGSNRCNIDTNAVEINIGKAIATKGPGGNVELFSVYPLIHGTVKSSEGEPLVEARNGLSPYYLTLAHELTHYKDYRDQLSKVRLEADRILNQESTLFHPPMGKILEVNRAPQQEQSRLEHRAIFDGDLNDTSELTLRMEANEPLRYLYQSGEKAIYEPIKTVLRHGIEFVKDCNKFPVAQKLSHYLHTFPEITKVRPAANIDARYMKLRLSQDSKFQESFRQISDLDNIQPFFKRRTGEERSAQVNESLQKSKIRLSGYRSFPYDGLQFAEESHLQQRLARRQWEREQLKNQELLGLPNDVTKFQKYLGIYIQPVQEVSERRRQETPTRNVAAKVRGSSPGNSRKQRFNPSSLFD